MIPTSYKSKISTKLSWPIGAEKISEAFEGLPQFSDFLLSFRGYEQNNVFKQDDIRVMTIEYSFRRPKSESMVRLGYGAPKWSISIYPVPKELKHLVKELLTQHFPQLYKWCLSHHNITKKEGCERVTVIFDSTIDELRLDEFSNMNPELLK
jgi:hypothetical protein